jgi:hypothetical protein
MDEMATLLGEERHLLDVLLYRLVTCRQLLVAGEWRFLPYASAEVEDVCERIRETELHRSLVVARLAGALHMPEGDLTLRSLCRHSRDPYGTIFSDHRQAFLILLEEIEAVVAENERLTPEPAFDTDVLVEAGSQAVLAAGAELSLPSLADFLA